MASKKRKQKDKPATVAKQQKASKVGATKSSKATSDVLPKPAPKLRRSLRHASAVEDVVLPEEPTVDDVVETVETGANGRPLRKGKSDVRPGVVHGGAKSQEDRMQQAIDREVNKQVADAKREWALERTARLKASPSELASIQDTRAARDNNDRHAMYNPEAMVDRDLPAPFYAPKPSTNSKPRGLKPGPADELDSDVDRAEDYELEENEETIDIQEPNGMEENEEIEGQVSKPRLSAAERKKRLRIQTHAATANARLVTRFGPDTHERLSNTNAQASSKAKSKKKTSEHEGFVAGFKPSCTPLRKAAPPPVPTDMPDVTERDIIGFDDDDVILLDGQYGRSLVKPMFVAVTPGLPADQHSPPSFDWVPPPSPETEAGSDGGRSYCSSTLNKRRNHSFSPDGASVKHSRHNSHLPTQHTSSVYVPSYTRGRTIDVRAPVCQPLAASPVKGIKKEAISTPAASEELSRTKAVRKLGSLSKANAIPEWLRPSYDEVLSTVAAALSCHDDLFAFGGEGGEETLLDIVVAVMQDRFPDRDINMTKTCVLYAKFREGMVNFRNTFRTHARLVVKEALHDVASSVSHPDVVTQERQSIRAVKVFVEDALVGSQRGFFKMSESIVKKGKKKGSVVEKKDGALQSTFIITTLARALHPNAQQKFSCPHVSFGMPWGALALAGYTVWQEFKAWTSGAYRETAALTKEVAGPASCAFFTEWVDPLKSKPVRLQEIRDVLAAAIALLSSSTGARNLQAGRNVAALSMPICPSSDDIDIDDFASDEDDD